MFIIFSSPVVEGVEYIPMSKSSEWEGEIKAGKLLDASKPTAVMCRSGVRSMRMAQFLVNEAKFAQVTPSP